MKKKKERVREKKILEKKDRKLEEEQKNKTSNSHASLGRAIGAVEDVDGCAAVIITSAACAEEIMPANRTRARRRSEVIEVDFIGRSESRGSFFFLL